MDLSPGTGSPYNIPLLYLFGKRNRSIRRAGRGEGDRRNARNLRKTMIEMSCHAPVQRYHCHRRVYPDKSSNVIRHRVPDPAVGTARPGTGSNNVPECEAFLSYTPAARRIRECGRDTEEFLRDCPEPVPRIAVIFTAGKGEDARETPEDKHAGRHAAEGTKTCMRNHRLFCRGTGHGKII